MNCPRAQALALLVLAAAVTLPAAAESESELRQQLEAQKALNTQLRQRIETLERQLSGTEPSPALRAPQAARAQLEPESVEGTTAIEEALLSRGLILLAPGSFRLTPRFSWTHTGSDSYRSRSDSYSGSLAGQAGLPLGMMIGAFVPYTHRNTSVGSNSGFGDLAIELSKKLNNESERMPSFIASLGYSHDSGDDAFEAIPVSFGFRTLTGSLSALKRIDPVALYGSLAYTHAFEKDVRAENLLGERRFSGRIAPGDVWAYRLGASLAATPDISLDASLSWAFVEGTQVRSDATGHRSLSRSTVAMLNLGAGFILTRELSLLLSASVGATDDSPDYSFSVALPYRF
jgi:hypothetical protein